MTRTCANPRCGVSLDGRRSDAKCCSDRCKAAIRAANKPTARVLHTHCMRCGGEIRARQRGAKFCSDECYYLNANEHGTAKSRLETVMRREASDLKCKMCAKPLKGNQKRKFCGKLCKGRYIAMFSPKSPSYAKRAEYQRGAYDRHIARVFKSAPPCKICGVSSARRSYKKLNNLSVQLIPDHPLCPSHGRSFSLFVTRRGLLNAPVEEVFTLWLARILAPGWATNEEVSLAAEILRRT